MPPDDFDAWRQLVQQFAAAMVERYGLDEVRDWYFEVWNGTIVPVAIRLCVTVWVWLSVGVWVGVVVHLSLCLSPCHSVCAPVSLCTRAVLALTLNLHCVRGTEMWGMEYPFPYLDLYNASAVALKAVDPNLQVGGPATMQVSAVYVCACLCASVLVYLSSCVHNQTTIQMGICAPLSPQVRHVQDFIANTSARGIPVDFVRCSRLWVCVVHLCLIPSLTHVHVLATHLSLSLSTSPPPLLLSPTITALAAPICTHLIPTATSQAPSTTPTALRTPYRPLQL